MLWQIWAEGYAATGEHGTATLLGTEEAETFNEAVAKLKVGHQNASLFKHGDDGYWRFWACRIFDNEVDARRAFE